MNNSYEAGRNNAKWNMKTNRSSHPLLRRWTTTLTRSRPMRQCSPEARTPCSIRDRETWPILKKRKIGIINAFKSFRAFYSFAHWHAQSSQPTGLQTCDNHINLDLGISFLVEELRLRTLFLFYDRFPRLRCTSARVEALVKVWCILHKQQFSIEVGKGRKQKNQFGICWIN